MSWNNTSYTNIIAKHPVLENKPESVALAVWALTDKEDMAPQDWRDLSAKTGVRVAGRAVGSARGILGLKTGKTRQGSKPGRKKKKGKRQGVRAGSAKTDRRGASSDLGNSVDLLVTTIKQLQRERDAAVVVLGKMRDLIGSLD